MSDKPNPTANPFVGPRALERGEAIFGREAETRKLSNLLIANRIIMLYSPSGAGKTSLIQAAMMPRLGGRNFDVLPTMRGNLTPPDELVSLPGFNRYVFSALTALEEGRSSAAQQALSDSSPPVEPLPPEALAGMSLNDYLAQQDRKRLLLIFDQFEEILTTQPFDRAGKMAFFEQLGEALRQPNRWALFAIREDYLGGLAPYTLPIPNRFKDTFRLDLLEADAARQVVMCTAESQGAHFTDEAASRLIDDLTRVRVQLPDGSFESQSGLYVEPVHLQVVCRDLWEKRDPGNLQITTDEIEKIGGVGEALGSYYDSQVRSVAEMENIPERKVRNWCSTQLVTEGDIRSQVLMGQEESGGLENKAIYRLVDAHLVRREDRRGSIWFELAHDRLIEPVKKSNAAWLQAHLSLLQRQAARWQRESRAEYLLLREQDLQDAESWAAQHPQELSQNDRDFLKVCQQLRSREEEGRASAENQLKLEAAEKVAEAERRRAEEQALAAKKLRKRFLVATLLLIVALLSTGAAIFAGVQASESASEAQTAEVIANSERETAEKAKSTAVAAEADALNQKGTAEYNAAIAATNEFKAKTANAIADSQREKAQTLSAQLAATVTQNIFDFETYKVTKENIQQTNSAKQVKTQEAYQAEITSLKSNIQINQTEIARLLNTIQGTPTLTTPIAMSMSAPIPSRTPTPTPADSPYISFLNVKIRAVMCNEQIVKDNRCQARPGATIKVELEYIIVAEDYCPYCIDEIQIGFSHTDPLTCIYQGIPDRNGTQGKAEIEITMPKEAGIYNLAVDRAQDYSCPSWWWNNRPPGEDQYFFRIEVP